MMRHTSQRRKVNLPKIHKQLFFFMLFSLMLGACIQVSTVFYGFQIFPQFLVLLPLAALTFFLWMSFPEKILARREEFFFIIAPIFILIFSVASVDPFDALNHSLTALYAGIVFILVRYLLKIGALKNSDLLKTVFVIFVILTLISVVQYMLQQPVLLPANYLGQNTSQVIAWNHTIRVSGTFVSPNVFALVYTIYGTIIVTICLYYYRSPRLYTALFTSVVVVFLVSTSLSRAGLLFSVILQTIVYFNFMLRTNRIQRWRIVFYIIFAGGVIIGIGSIFSQDLIYQGWERFSPQHVDVNRRLDTYKGAARLLTNPEVALLGVGTGQFFKASAEQGIYYYWKLWVPQEKMSTVHNWTLQIAVENGLIVLFLYVYAFLKTAYRGWSVRKMPRGWLPASLAIIFIILYMTAVQVDTSGNGPWIMTLVAIILAWIQNEYDEIKS